MYFGHQLGQDDDGSGNVDGSVENEIDGCESNRRRIDRVRRSEEQIRPKFVGSERDRETIDFRAEDVAGGFSFERVGEQPYRRRTSGQLPEKSERQDKERGKRRRNQDGENRTEDLERK